MCYHDHALPAQLQKYLAAEEERRNRVPHMGGNPFRAPYLGLDFSNAKGDFNKFWVNPPSQLWHYSADKLSIWSRGRKAKR
ncbi:hypothetical protein DL768_007971 [Monosporascus sp. mg162]|nr:hypothetical protein DL768_007971 [Monosporascus sp. mg162]